MMRGDTGTKTNDIGNDHLDDWSDPLSELRSKITLAKGQKRVDLVIKNANLVNVLSGQIYQTDVAIVGDFIVGLGEGYEAKHTFEANGQYLFTWPNRWSYPYRIYILVSKGIFQRGFITWNFGCDL